MTDLITDRVRRTTTPDRLAEWVDRFAALDERPGEPGVTRRGYTGLEREAHRIFADEMTALGLSVRVDAAGNTIAELRGSRPELGAVGTGSHLDSVPNGGRFDGVAGVVAALEAARSVVEAGGTNLRTLRFVAFAGEEGARFGQACTGSRAVAGLLEADAVTSLVDADGITLGEAMTAVGLAPEAVQEALWEASDWDTFIELHIEQGSVLADAAIPVGIVDVISGSTRFTIDVAGRASHTGGTPMRLRADALTTGSAIILAAEELANDARHHGTRITVGRIDVAPGSITTIAGHCTLHVDVRDTDSTRQRESAAELIELARSISASRGTSIEVRLLADASPAVLPLSTRNHLVATATELGLPYRIMPSGASHDTQMVNQVCTGGMIFVPSLNGGVSHSPDEDTAFEDLAVGVDLLTAALFGLAYPKRPEENA